MRPTDDAFPTFTDMDTNVTGESGLSKREYFAIRIMAGFAVNMTGAHGDRAADKAIEWADALIRSLNKE